MTVRKSATQVKVKLTLCAEPTLGWPERVIFDQIVTRKNIEGYWKIRSGRDCEQYIRGKRDEMTEITICEQCGRLALIQRSVSHVSACISSKGRVWGPQAICSTECLNKLKAERQAARRKEQRRLAVAPRNCGRCGESFNPKRSDAKFCSARCRVAANRLSTNQN